MVHRIKSKGNLTEIIENTEIIKTQLQAFQCYNYFVYNITFNMTFNYSFKIRSYRENNRENNNIITWSIGPFK